LPAELLTDAPGCPKHMEFGPCGGVEFDGTCEVGAASGGPGRCVFLDTPVVRWHGGTPSGTADAPGASKMREVLATKQIVVTDFPARALDASSLAECAAVLRGTTDVVLAGDSGRERVQFPPAYRTALIRAEGVEVWSGFTCRDRNRVAMEAELAALAHAGVSGVHCVTGDHTRTGSRPDAAPVFDLDSTQAASLARAAGHLVSVAEAPATPPVERRPARLLEKERAGAEICFVNHAGGVDPVATFIAEAHALGSKLGFIPCIPIVLDHDSAELLKSFTTLVLPPGYLDRILAAADPRAEGIAAAVELGRGFQAIPGVVGVNLSGGTGFGGELEFARALAEIAAELGRAA
jgi:5,10-methylenetetrahydrofolate reductase